MKRLLAIVVAACALIAPGHSLTLQEALLDALVPHGAPGDGAVSIVGRAPTGLDPSTLDIAKTEYNPQNGRFVVQIKMASGRLFGIQGKVEAGLDMPVLTRAFRTGDIATDEDVMFVRVPQSSVQRGALTSAADVVGFSAKRQLRAGVALRAGDFEKPVIVRKGDAVTMVFRMPGIELTTRGKAMSNGGLGDTVPVVNVQSHKQVEAVITGSGSVTVSPQRVAIN
jgi:flagella basal body P-ring formation protein FlgA